MCRENTTSGENCDSKEQRNFALNSSQVFISNLVEFESSRSKEDVMFTLDYHISIS